MLGRGGGGGEDFGLGECGGYGGWRGGGLMLTFWGVGC